MKQPSVRFPILALLLAVMVSLATSVAVPTAKAQSCQFVLGFQAIHSLIPDIIGDCVADVSYNAGNGDELQQATGRLLVWRKADNYTAFTNGSSTWINGRFGLQNRSNDTRFWWESDAALYPLAAIPVVNVAASVSDANPFQVTSEIVLGEFTADVVGISGLPMQTTWHYKTTTGQCNDGVTDTNGLAFCFRPLSDATLGDIVTVDVTFNFQGKTYTAQTHFTPQ